MFLADLNTNLKAILDKLQTLIDEFWVFVVGILAAVVVIWCVYVAIKLIIAHRNEERVDAKRMIKNLIVGIVVMFVLAFGVPLLIEGLQTWSGVTL